jgi:hypothetical protein
MSLIRFASFSLAVVTLMVIQYAMSIAIAGVLFGLSSEVILSTVLAIIGSMYATMYIAPSVVAISEVVVEKVSFTASKVSRFFREKRDEFEAYRFNKANGLSFVRS